MKKFAKLSLVASVALASTTFANAKPLEEAIKNVDVSGTVAYRYNDYEDKSGNSASNNYKAAVSLKSKVNDDVTANIRLIAGNATDAQSFGTSNEADKSIDVSLSEVNFTYTGINNTLITLGKQAIDTPFTMARDSIGVEATGTGIVASTNVGPVDLTAAYFNQTNLNVSNELKGSNPGDFGVNVTGSENLIFVGANLNISNVNIDASYVDLADILDAYTIGLKANYNVGEVALNSFARYSSLDRDDVDTDNNLFKIGVGAKIGIYGANLAYGETDKEGGTVAFDGSAEAGMDEHWRVTLTGEKDASVVYASVNAQVTPKLNVALKYSDMERGSNQTDLNEIYVQTTYNMSKNLMTYIRFGQYDNEVDEYTSGRLHVQYSF